MAEFAQPPRQPQTLETPVLAACAPLGDPTTDSVVGEVSLNGRRSPIPSRNPTVRRRVREMADVLGYEPTPGDLYALTRWAHLFEKWRSIGERLDEYGDVRADGEPKKLLSEWRALSDALSRLEAQLGITASARASLGLDIGRLRKMAEQGTDDDDADVAELERRYLAKMTDVDVDVHRDVEQDQDDGG